MTTVCGMRQAVTFCRGLAASRIQIRAYSLRLEALRAQLSATVLAVLNLIFVHIGKPTSIAGPLTVSIPQDCSAVFRPRKHDRMNLKNPTGGHACT